MSGAIFLSASVPDPKRSPRFAETADPVAITAAVTGLVHVLLGRRLLVWGGHPAITPMIVVVAESMGVDYGRWVRLYQSNFFKVEFPEDNERFQNVTYTDAVANDLPNSLRVMRERMFSNHVFDAAVFIGGMEGILREAELFRHLQPRAKLVPVVSTGGASRRVVEEHLISADLWEDFDYVALFHRHLNIDQREERFPTPEEQPANIEDRFWKDDASKR